MAAVFDKYEVGKRLVEVRDKLNKNSRRFATEASLDVSYIGKIEKGDKPISKKYLDALENKYGINSEWLLMGKGEMFIPNSPNKVEDPNQNYKIQGMSDSNNKTQAQRNNNHQFDSLMSLTEIIIRTHEKQTDALVSLVNILTGKEKLPKFIQELLVSSDTHPQSDSLPSDSERSPAGLSDKIPWGNRQAESKDQTQKSEQKDNG